MVTTFEDYIGSAKEVLAYINQNPKRTEYSPSPHIDGKRSLLTRPVVALAQWINPDLKTTKGSYFSDAKTPAFFELIRFMYLAELDYARVPKLYENIDKPMRDANNKIILQSEPVNLIEEIERILSSENIKDSTDKDKLKQMLTLLYEVFELYSGSEEGVLKQFKSHIHHVARELQAVEEIETVKRYDTQSNVIKTRSAFESRLFHLQKLENSLNSKNVNKASETVDNDFYNKLQERGHPQKTYAYIPRDIWEIDPVRSDEERNKNNQIKSKLKETSVWVSAIVAIGQGLIPFVFAIAVAGLPLAIAIGIAATACNYFLFKGDSYSVLKSIWRWEFFKDTKTNQPFSSGKKTAMMIGLFLAITSALSSGFLAFVSTQAGVIKIALLFSMSSGPVAPIVLAALIGGLTAFALGAVFTQIVSTWIREDSIPKFFKNFTPAEIKKFFTQDANGLVPEGLKAQIIFGIGRGLKLLFNAVFMAAAVAVSIVAVGLFTAHSSVVFRYVDTALRVSDRFAGLATLGLSSVVNLLYAVFYAKALMFLKTLTEKTIQAVIHPVKSTKDFIIWIRGLNIAQKAAIEAENENSRSNAAVVPPTVGETIRKHHRILSLIKRVLLLTAVALNASGQGDGADNKLSTGWLDKVLFNVLSFRAVAHIGGGVLASGSGAANGKASLESTAAIGALTIGVSGQSSRKNASYVISNPFRLVQDPAVAAQQLANQSMFKQPLEQSPVLVDHNEQESNALQSPEQLAPVDSGDSQDASGVSIIPGSSA